MYSSETPKMLTIPAVKGTFSTYLKAVIVARLTQERK